jgi:hypothetical protein
MSTDRMAGSDPDGGAGSELLQRVAALSRPGAAEEAQYGAAGVTFQAPPPTHRAIFEITEAMTYPDIDDAPGDHFDRDPTPSAKAMMVWCCQNGPNDVDANGTPVPSYGGTAHSQEVVVWHPAAYRGNGCGSYAGVPPGYACGTPTFAVGEHVACQWNRQSGRWEIEAPALNIWRVELKDTFMPIQSQINVALNDAATDLPFTAFRPDGHRTGVGRAGGVGPNGRQYDGTHAYAIWSPVRQQWEFLTDQFKLLAEGTAYDAIDPGTTGRVNLWWLDYPSGTLVNTGLIVVAENWLHPHIACSEKVIVSYDRQEDRWTILAADFTTRYQPLSVVTGVTLSLDAASGTYSLHYTTQQIQLPPWVQIGPPVQN